MLVTLDYFKMNYRFIWLFITLGEIIPKIIGNERLGTLNFEVNYENTHGIVSSGYYCDSFLFNRLCDIFFEICVSEMENPITYFKMCNIFSKTTSPVRNTHLVNYNFEVPYYTNKLLDVRIKALDHDHLSSPDMLGEFHFQFWPFEVPSKYQTQKPASYVSNAHLSTTMKLYMSRKCEPDHFGDRCELCRAKRGHGYCDELGNLVCYPGYYGDECRHERGCHNMNCASFASCDLVDGNFACVCDGTSGKRCEEGYDPCEDHFCWHEGTCLPTGEHFNFAKCVNCTGRWSGVHCDEEMDACEYEASKIGHPPCINGGHCVANPTNETEFTCLCAPGWQGPHCEISFSRGKVKEDACDLEASKLGHSPCANGGHCVVDPSNKTMFSCLCAPGWQGSRCNVSFSKASAVVTVVSIFLLILIICIVIGLTCCIRIFALPKIRQIITKQKGIDLTQANECGLSEANNIYQLMQDPRPSPPPSYTTTWRKEGDIISIKLIPPISPMTDDGDYDEYEYEALLDQVKCPSAKEAPGIPEEEDYEPINYKHPSTLKSRAAKSAANNEYDDNDYAPMETTLSRPLPSTPAPDGEDYKFLCQNESGKDQIC